MTKKTGRDQSFTDGVVRLCEVKNVAPPGKKPVEQLGTREILRFKERTVGIQRFYTALQANVRVERVIRCPCLRSVSTQDIAVVEGNQYVINLIQYPEDLTPPVMDLTLSEVVQVYAEA